MLVRSVLLFSEANLSTATILRYAYSLWYGNSLFKSLPGAEMKSN
jgi:uncharacterized protein YerC